jgi:hypothetical protein
MIAAIEPMQNLQLKSPPEALLPSAAAIRLSPGVLNMELPPL